MRKFDVVLLKDNIDINFLGEHLQTLDDRPCVIVSNNRNNQYCDNINIVPLTTKLNKVLPCHAILKSTRRKSYALCESVHSEQNAIISARRQDMIGSTLYLVGIENTGEYIKDARPCKICARLIANSGISKLIIRKTKKEFEEIIL